MSSSTAEHATSDECGPNHDDEAGVVLSNVVRYRDAYYVGPMNVNDVVRCQIKIQKCVPLRAMNTFLKKKKMGHTSKFRLKKPHQ